MLILLSHSVQNINGLTYSHAYSLWDLRDILKPAAVHQIWSKELSDPVNDIQFHIPYNEDQVKAVVACGNSIQTYTFDWRYSNVIEAPEASPKFSLSCPVNSVSLHPTEKLLVCGGDDHIIYRLNSETGEILGNILSILWYSVVI